MKLRLGLLLSLCLLAIAGCVTTRPTTTSDIIARYPFDGNLLDSSGHHHDAIARGNVRYGVDVSGRPGKALILNGHAILTVADSPDLHFTPTSSFSIYTWIRTVDTGDAGILCKGPTNNSVPGYRLELKGGHPRAEITALGSNVDLIGPKSIADNKWHLLTMTVSTDTVNLYLDTTLVGQKLHAHLRPDSAMGTSTLKIGSQPNGTGGLIGRLDDLSLLPRAIDRHSVVTTWSGRSSTITMADLPPGERGLSTGSNALGMCWLSDTIGLKCGNAGMIMRTIDGGVTWASVRSGGIDLFSVAGSGSNCVAVGYGTDYYISADKGLTWQQRSIDLTALSVNFQFTVAAGAVHLLAAQFLNNNSVVAVGAVQNGDDFYGIVLSSANAGQNWAPEQFNASQFNGTSLLSPFPLNCISVGPAGVYIVAGSNHSMFRWGPPSGGGANQWAQINVGAGAAFITGCSFKGSDALAVTDEGEFFETHDGGNNWADAVSWVGTFNYYKPTCQATGLFSVSANNTNGDYIVCGDGGLILKYHNNTITQAPVATSATAPSIDEFWLRTVVKPGGSVAMMGTPTANYTHWMLQ
jgi:photosystem II stability/assembly factor-like uncharacterized protein